jgi:hypothetical protein
MGKGLKIDLFMIEENLLKDCIKCFIFGYHPKLFTICMLSFLATKYL